MKNGRWGRSCGPDLAAFALLVARSSVVTVLLAAGAIGALAALLGAALPPG